MITCKQPRTLSVRAVNQVTPDRPGNRLHRVRVQSSSYKMGSPFFHLTCTCTKYLLITVTQLLPLCVPAPQMMWNWAAAVLSVDGAALVAFDGSPGHPDLAALWRVSAEEGVTHLGASPK